MTDQAYQHPMDDPDFDPREAFYEYIRTHRPMIADSGFPSERYGYELRCWDVDSWDYFLDGDASRMGYDFATACQIARRVADQQQVEVAVVQGLLNVPIVMFQHRNVPCKGGAQ